MTEKTETAKEKQKKKGKTIWLILLLLLLILAAGGVIFYLLFWNKEERPRIDKELSAKAGLLPTHSEEELQELLNKTVQEGMVNISINPDPVFQNGKSKGSLNIENIPANHYNLQVDIKLEETDEVIYRSGLIEPGHYVDNASLTKNLKKGNHKAVAVFTAYYPDNDTDILAKASAHIVLHIEN